MRRTITKGARRRNAKQVLYEMIEEAIDARIEELAVHSMHYGLNYEVTITVWGQGEEKPGSAHLGASEPKEGAEPKSGLRRTSPDQEAGQS